MGIPLTSTQMQNIIGTYYLAHYYVWCLGFYRSSYDSGHWNHHEWIPGHWVYRSYWHKVKQYYWHASREDIDALEDVVFHDAPEIVDWAWEFFSSGAWL
jgi:hypothetical protein